MLRDVGRSDVPAMVGAAATATGSAGTIASADAWFGAGERIGYGPKARALVAAEDARLKVFLRCEGDGAICPSSPRRWWPLTFLRWSSWSTCGDGLNA